MGAKKPISFDCLQRQTLVFLMAGESAVLSSGCVGVCDCLDFLHCLDQAGLEVRVAARGAAQQQVLLVYQAVQEVLLPVVVVDLEEGHHCDRQPGEPSCPQAKLQERDTSVNTTETNRGDYK